MARTVASVTNNVRTLLRDRSLSDALFNSFEINYHVMAEAERLFQEIGIGASWELGIVTIVPDTYEYTITVTAGLVEQVIALRLASRNWPIQRITNDELEAMRRGPSVSKSYPQFAAMWEDSAQSIKLRVWPIPAQADTIDWLRSRAPVWDTNDIPGTSIPLSDPALRVLEMKVAKRLLLQCPADALNSRLSAKDLATQLDRDIADGIRLERSRLNRFKRTGRIALGDA